MSGRSGDEGSCFVCGKANPHGLHVGFTKTDGGASAEFIADSHFQGYEGIVHGGVVAALLDEASAKALLLDGVRALTAEITLRYKSPLLVGQRAKVTARVSGVRGRVCRVDAEMRGETGEVIALSTAKLFIQEDSCEEV